MEIGIFIPSGSQFDNEVPAPHHRKNSVFWSFLQPVLGLPAEHLPWDNDGVSPNMARIREYEARRAEANNAVPPQVTLGDLASEAVTHVVEAVRGKVKKPTKLSLAVTWLSSELQQGPQPQTELEEKGLKAGYNLKMLKAAKKKLKVESTRKGRSSWAWRLPFAKVKGGQIL
jgi:hypothetical protein